DASLVLQELVLAMQHGLTLRDVAETIHTYPTSAGLIHRLAGEFVAGRPETSFVRQAPRWFHGYHAPARDAHAATTPPPAATAPRRGCTHRSCQRAWPLSRPDPT